MPDLCRSKINEVSCKLVLTAFVRSKLWVVNVTQQQMTRTSDREIHAAQRLTQSPTRATKMSIKSAYRVPRNVIENVTFSNCHSIYLGERERETERWRKSGEKIANILEPTTDTQIYKWHAMRMAMELQLKREWTRFYYVCLNTTNKRQKKKYTYKNNCEQLIEFHWLTFPWTRAQTHANRALELVRHTHWIFSAIQRTI